MRGPLASRHSSGGPRDLQKSPLAGGSHLPRLDYFEFLESKSSDLWMDLWHFTAEVDFAMFQLVRPSSSFAVWLLTNRSS